ncbi:MAG: hypothetical protein U0234_12435 [Sandaracinus sp.]
MPTFSDIAFGLSPKTRDKLLAARGLAIDPRKVLSPGEQTMRALAVVTRERWASLSPTARAALERLVPAPGIVPRAELGGAALALVEAGLAFVVDDDVVCPAAIRLQLPAAPGEDPRSARALYARLSDETLRVLHHGALRERAGGPRFLGLGELLERVEDPRLLTREIESAPLADRLALSAIEARGGEVARETFLDVTREPARYGTGGGLPLRGVAQSLLSSGLVVPVPGDRYVLPTEVALVAGRERRAALERRRADVRARIEASEEDTVRAELAEDPGPLALALLVERMASGDLSRTDAPAPRSALARVAKALHVRPERAELLLGLMRALPLRTARVRDVGPALVALYRTSAVGDETRLHPARASRRAVATGIVALRELAESTLLGLPRGRFVPRAEVIAIAKADLRAEGIELGLAEAARAAPADVSPSLERALEVVFGVSLPTLGLVDVAEDGALRLASRALRSQPPEDESDEVLPSWDGARARLHPDTRVVHALALAPVARAAVDEGVVLVLDPARAAPLAVEKDALARALERAGAPEDVRREALAALPDARATLVASELVRWIAIDDAALRERLLADPAIARITLPESPPSGLLVHGHGSFPRLLRLFARHGVDLRKPA